jgi:hypothetical protein
MNMIASINMSSESVDLLKRRGLSDQQVSSFAELLDEAHTQQEKNISAKQVLSNMTADELQLLQKATSLAEPIKIGSLSKESSINLLAQPDRTGLVDLNNDGIVEVGAAKNIVFPPVNAPAHIKAAWEEATAHLSEQDKMTLEFHSHFLTHGVLVDDKSAKVPLSPEEQWSPEGIKQWLIDARSALDFSVQHGGWTHSNLIQQDFYDRFETALSA